MSIILDGQTLRDKLAPALKQRIAALPAQPKLAIIQVGSLGSSDIYIKHKKDFAEAVGASVIHKQYPEDVSEQEIINDIEAFNADESVHGIMMQLPIPKHLETGRIMDTLDPRKDVDGLGSYNTKRLFDNNEAFLPATTLGILTLLEHYEIALKGKLIAVIGESQLVGRPTALALLNRGATVSVCHIHTQNLAEETRRADIIIVAVGKPGLITSEHVREGQVVVDIGITRADSGSVIGDTDYRSIKEAVGAITPVPGGVGPMTVYSLLDNLVRAAENLA